ncbi:SMU1112c/YaeR family gloxylase I-like metalloprotein [Gloeothece verrucosa]|uniref:Glyoxalase/bleomycin resistance protein/dioxygenase n=1 Tax=Gloeothece verrucosa (strain PCC 7822) TaxID=497965 RepID=E0UEY1_GLOV7|nr:VOC family protein [Gloeothece verrucosa]ADN13111.1 Glyoxalase/bleomycin resistance protein/dioxygenase [Gloeothece verrucosa PCC 7822]
MKINKFHHIAIICSDYERSKHFYVDILKCSVIRETFRSQRNSYKLDLQVGDQDIIELFSFPSPPPRRTGPEPCGLRHLAFSVDNLDETINYLTSQGIEVEPVRLDELTGKRFTFFKDPDGLPLELYEE